MVKTETSSPSVDNSDLVPPLTLGEVPLFAKSGVFSENSAYLYLFEELLEWKWSFV